jgi:hypothetical protein
MARSLIKTCLLVLLTLCVMAYAAAVIGSDFEPDAGSTTRPVGNGA